jgi:RimJ/RimL family protein N-acetyltransferase
MKFVANVDFNGGQLRPLAKSDVDSIVNLYQKQTLSGQSASASKEHAERMVELSVQMAATQRGLMWAIEAEYEGESCMLGMLSLYDWQPSSLKTLMRLDAMPALSEELQVNALRSAIEFLSGKYHLRNFSFHCLPKGDEKVVSVLEKFGFTQQARLRDFRRISQTEYSDVLLYNYLLEAPVLGEDK